MIAELISIGDEILSGHTVNTNATFISKELFDIEYETSRHLVIGDEKDEIVRELTVAVKRAEVVIVTGGLGPTHDDITLDAVAGAFDRPLQLDESAKASIEEFFRARGRSPDAIHEEQAHIPQGAKAIPNTVGTAPGIHLEIDGTHLFVLPGVPAEMKAMINYHVIPFLRSLIKPTSARVRLYTTGIPESKLYEKIREVIERYPNVKVAFLPGQHGVKIRARVALESTEKSQDEVNRWKEDVRSILGTAIYSEEDERIEIVIGDLLREKNATLATAESCTGGLIGQRLTSIPGSSDYYTHGFVTYSNDAKTQLLGVEAALIKKEGAVSEAVAIQMADGALAHAGTTYAISVTGIAGPSGGTEEKPVGLTYIGLAGGGETICRKFLFGNQREINRVRSSQAALNMVRKRLLGEL